MASLIINHLIYLTEKECYDIHNEKNLRLEKIGVSVPVFIDQKILNKEKEVFCKYEIENKEDFLVHVQETKTGYFINLPQLTSMTKNKVPPTSKNLLNIKDGGISYLLFKEYNKKKIKNKLTNILHVVEIKRIEVLTGNLS